MAPPKGGNQPSVTPVTRGMGSRSINLRNILNGFAQDPNNPAFVKLKAMSKDLQAKIVTSYTYDYASTSTQNRRKLHLAEYIDIIKATVKVNETNGEEHEDWEKRLWGPEFVADNLRAYVLMISQVLQPRSFVSPSIQFSTLAARRQSMIYWVIQKCDQKVVSISDVWNGSNRALYMAFRSHNMAVVAPPKLYANKDDMRNLIEYITYAEANVEMAQQMVIAWLDGFICGVRPGSIGASQGRMDQYLRWEDIEIFRDTDGNFRMVITHKWLKGYRDEKLRPLRFSVTGPQNVEDSLFSLPHRLLALALRRGFLAHYDTVDELLKDTRTKITFKPMAMKQPVVLANSPKGIDLISGKPARASGLTTYLQRIALDFGLPPNVTMYIWRRSAGTTVGRALGDTSAKGFLGHNMDHKSYETSYEQGPIAMDVMNIAMGGKIRQAGELLADDTLSVNRIKEYTNNKAQWTKKYIEEHAEFKRHNAELQQAESNLDSDDEDEAAEDRVRQARNHLEKCRRTLQNQAAIALQELELSLIKENMTSEQLEKRLKDAKAPGELARRLNEAAEAARKDAENEVEPQPETMQPDDFLDSRDRAEQMADDENEDQLVRDLDSPDVIATNNLSKDQDITPKANSASKDSADAKALAAANKMLLTLLVEQTAADPSAMSTCKSCEVDETVPNTLSDEYVNDPANRTRNQFKEKLYKRSDLLRHLATDFHSPRDKWYRGFADKTASYRCPYAEEPIAEGEGEGEGEGTGEGEGEEEGEDVVVGKRCECYDTPGNLLKHITLLQSQTDEHLLNAARAGIFNRDFDPAMGRVGGKVKATGKKGGGYQYEAFADPDSFDAAAFVPPGNITADGEVEEDENATPYAKTIRLPPNAPLVESTLWSEHSEGFYGHAADVLQQQRSFIARRADAILRQHSAVQSETGATLSKAAKGKGKRKIAGIAALRKRLTDLGFDWGVGIDGDDEGDGAEDGEGGAENEQADPEEE
ncbi:unnamed protein product [Zymoseptoria tritici ST99CH_1E4]|uniref:Uncharacterized protein n=1 Tax=Zymoseptoria tritici ST99CH_1E4 TaxID=1276532 RepID=A0A2H1G3M5_ZYMTR|nr:unnamed protein product [Zymoseptoria tritici ST99CH_1E4]